MSTQTEKKFKRKLNGVIVSTKSTQTIVVEVHRRYKHGKYSKFLDSSKKYHAHDEKSEAKMGDAVTIIESRPHSKLKNWELYSINN